MQFKTTYAHQLAQLINQTGEQKNIYKPHIFNLTVPTQKKKRSKVCYQVL
jgi:hypothetical protein